jgi:uncharacterized protein YbaR (Trm112 family)
VSEPVNSLPPELLSILRCPRTGESLQIAASDLVNLLNEQIAANNLRDANGEPVVDRIDGGLVNAGGQWCYPIRDQIPALIPGEALPVSEPSIR